jgi:sodium--glutamate symport carrier gltS
MACAASVLQAGGLVAGFLAAFFLAKAQQESNALMDGRETSTGMREYKVVVLFHPSLWSWGLYLLVIGFVLQLAGFTAERWR